MKPTKRKHLPALLFAFTLLLALVIAYAWHVGKIKKADKRPVTVCGN